MLERLQKVLARAGVGSRRKCEEYITAGRVSVDGKVVRELGAKADASENIVCCDGERIKPEPRLYFLINKPRNVVCSNVPEGGHVRVTDLIPGVEQRLFTVGRLDVDSEGLIIITNDGELANRLAHPRYEVERVYMVEIDGVLTPADSAKLRKGVHLAEGVVRFQHVSSKPVGRARSRVKVVIRQGLNREIRRAFAATGHRVRRLRRVAIGPISDAALRPGAYRKLSEKELSLLRQESPAAAKRPPRRVARPRRARITKKTVEE